MKIRRYGAAVAVAAAGALLFSACSSSSDDTPQSTTTQGTGGAGATGGTITVAEVNSFFTFNPLTSNGNTDINSKIALATQGDFWYIDDQLKVQRDEGFGKFEVVKQDPFTVKYTLNPQTTWSDGTPVDASDLLFAWAVQSGWYNDGTTDATGTVTKGTNYFDYAGSTTGLNHTKLPTIGDDNKSITIEYTQPYADWEIALQMRGMPPAHVVWKHAGIASEDDFIKLLQDQPKGDPAHPAATNAELKKVADFYNTGFDSTTLPSDPSLYLANGPYIVSTVDDGKSVTLVPNKAYKGDHPAKLDSIVMRTIPDAQAQIQALQNGEVDVIAPQADADTLQALEGLQNINIHKGAQLAYDHIDLNFTGVFEDKNVREAFLKTIPRQAILDAIITPLDPSAQVLNSQVFVPAQPGYADSVKNNGSSAFGEPDIAGAKALLAGKTPTVRILYNSDNPNRVDAYTLIAQSASQAGFRIVNEGDPKWGSRLGDGSYDASIFGWTNSGVGVSGVPQLFGTGQSSNFSRYSNKDVDSLADQLVQTTDVAKQTSLMQQIDAHLFADAFGLPFFQSVGVDAESTRVHGIDTFQPNQNGVWWNVWDWSVDN